MLQQAWHLPFRNLVLAMPITAGLIAVVTYALTDLGWTESFSSARCCRRPTRCYALGVAFVAYGMAVLPPEGNGFIAVFVAAIAFGGVHGGGRQPPGRHCRQGVHVLVRPEGGRHDDLRPVRLGSTAPEAERIAGLAALVVFISVIAHGLTDHPGAEWMARRAEREREPAAA